VYLECHEYLVVPQNGRAEVVVRIHSPGLVESFSGGLVYPVANLVEQVNLDVGHRAEVLAVNVPQGAAQHLAGELEARGDLTLLRLIKAVDYQSKTAPPPDGAMALGEQALQRDTKGMFRFNPDKEGKAVPDYNPYTVSRCRDCDIAKGKFSLAKKVFIPDNELCQACQLLQKCAADKTKSERTIERIHYLHTMEPLLKKSVTLNTEDRDIRVGFTTYGNKHLFSDTFGRSSVMTKDDLATLDKVLETTSFIESSPLTHPRSDEIDRFFYYEATIKGQKVRLNVARKVKIRKDGRHIATHFLYSVNDIKKSTGGDG